MASSVTGQIMPPVIGAAAFSWSNMSAFPISTWSSTPFCRP
ncbi:MAG: hypothetical protein R3C97_10335 [Geminicoccaceae bacterium]